MTGNGNNTNLLKICRNNSWNHNNKWTSLWRVLDIWSPKFDGPCGFTSLLESQVWLTKRLENYLLLLLTMETNKPIYYMMIFLSTVIVFSSPTHPSTHKSTHDIYKKSNQWYLKPTMFGILSFHQQRYLKISLFLHTKRPPLRNMYYYKKDDFECQ